jgi:TolA-binding protein
MFWLFRYHYGRGEIPTAETYFQEAVSAEQRDAVQMNAMANDFKVEELPDIKAAYAGDPSAMFRLGEHFEARKRNEDAKDWYRKAHDNGCASAREAMVRVLRSENKEAAAKDWERKGTAPSVENVQHAAPTA